MEVGASFTDRGIVHEDDVELVAEVEPQRRPAIPVGLGVKFVTMRMPQHGRPRRDGRRRR
jgi:hypothetical protein